MSERAARAARRATGAPLTRRSKRGPFGVVRQADGIVMAKGLARESAEALVKEIHAGPISGTWEVRDLSDTRLIRLEPEAPAR